MLETIIKDHKQFSFEPAGEFRWSPSTNTIHYQEADPVALWPLLHELGHALCGHKTFRTDVELLRIEVEAWDKARALAANYLGKDIDSDYIENCMDTYRDWLRRRATCPECQLVSIQQNSGDYHCFNCGCEWKVPSSQGCRVTRQKI